MFITAEKIHDGHRWLPSGTVIELSDDGMVIALHSGYAGDVTFYEGVLIPGLVNAHCHLELSHMKGLIPEHTSLIPFLKKIPAHRNDFTPPQKEQARYRAFDELLRNGVVAVGDIANTTETLDLRAMGKMHFYTFVESIGFAEEAADKFFGFSLQTYNQFAGQPEHDKILHQAIVPHAPYSVSPSLFRFIDAHHSDVISIHNQESEEENTFYIRKEGAVRDLLANFNIDDNAFIPTGSSSLQSYLQWLPSDRNIIFVHNTYSSREDVQYAHSRVRRPFWCLCPNANLYIENRLPDIQMLVSEGANICIGTDSLASNHQLCVISELFTIKEHYPHFDWDTLIAWGTRNGALALQMQDTIGTIEEGKKPGIVQVMGLGTDTKPGVRKII